MKPSTPMPDRKPRTMSGRRGRELAQDLVEPRRGTATPASRRTFPNSWPTPSTPAWTPTRRRQRRRMLMGWWSRGTSGSGRDPGAEPPGPSFNWNGQRTHDLFRPAAPGDRLSRRQAEHPIVRNAEPGAAYANGDERASACSAQRPRPFLQGDIGVERVVGLAGGAQPSRPHVLSTETCRRSIRRSVVLIGGAPSCSLHSVSSARRTICTLTSPVMSRRPH